MRGEDPVRSRHHRQRRRRLADRQPAGEGGEVGAHPGEGAAVPTQLPGAGQAQRVPPRRADLRRPREDPQHRRCGQQGRVVLFEPRRARPQRRAARLPRAGQRRSRHDRRVHRAGGRRRDPALRRRLAPLHPDRPPPQELQRRPRRHPRRRPPRGPRLADPVRRAGPLLRRGRGPRRHQRHAGQPDQAVPDRRPLPAPALAEPDQPVREGRHGGPRQTARREHRSRTAHRWPSSPATTPRATAPSRRTPRRRRRVT